MLVRDLRHEARLRMEVLLLPPNPGRDWKTLADKMGFPREEILYLECKNEPVLELLNSSRSERKTIAELFSLLEEMERIDVIEELKSLVGKPLVCELFDGVNEVNRLDKGRENITDYLQNEEQITD